MRLVLNPRDEPEAFRADVDRYLDIIVIQTAGTVKIILDHTADRNRNAKLIKDAQGYVDLPTSAIHHDEIRESAEAAHLIAHSLFIQLTALLQTMGKTADQHLLHARIIVHSLYGLDLEFTVITALRLSLFIDDH